VEERICARLGLQAASVTSQVIQRDRHAAFVAASRSPRRCARRSRSKCAICSAPKCARRKSIRARPEGQLGHAAQTQPVTCEQICGLARVVRSNVQAAFEDVGLWHERDISHSSVERVILPDSCILADYLLDKTVNLVDKLLVYPDRMRRNLDLTRGLVFSGQLLLDLARAGMLREQAYKTVQAHAMRAWKGVGFRAAIEADLEIRAVLTPTRSPSLSR